jgi:hypothetical protein
MLANANAKPLKLSVGLPAMPSPLVMPKPLPETPIRRFVTVLEFVLTMMPFPAVSRLPEAPFKVTRR